MVEVAALGAIRGGAAVLFGISAVSGCSQHAAAPAQLPAQTTKVDTAVAQRGVLQRSQELSGLIAPVAIVALSDTLAEPTLKVYVREGDVVHRGQLLARLATADLQGQLQAATRTAASDAAKAAAASYTLDYTLTQVSDIVRQKRSLLAQAKHNLLNDRRNLARDTQLLAQGYVSLKVTDQARSLVRNDISAVNSAQAALVTAQESVSVNGTPSKGLQASTVAAAREQRFAQEGTANQIRAQIGKATIVAPLDGVIANRNLNPGEYPSGRQIFTIEQIAHVYAVLDASATQVADIHEGAPAVLGIGTQRLHGRVTAILDQVQPGATNYAVKVLFANPQRSLRPGMPVVASVALPALHGVQIPESAFLSNDRNSVFEIVRQRVRTVPVTLVGDNGKNAVVSGLRSGARVVRDGTSSLDPGQRVAVH